MSWKCDHATHTEDKGHRLHDCLALLFKFLLHEFAFLLHLLLLFLELRTLVAETPHPKNMSCYLLDSEIVFKSPSVICKIRITLLVLQLLLEF